MVSENSLSFQALFYEKKYLRDYSNEIKEKW